MLLGSSVSLFQCKCGYDLRGLTGDRCPGCGITVIRIKPMQPYLLSGFLWGFGVLAVPAVALMAWVLFQSIRFAGEDIGWGYFGLGILFVFSIAGLVAAVGTGLFGMLIGYIVSCIRLDRTVARWYVRGRVATSIR